MVSCTIVTAFYPIRSKFPKDVYIQWAHNFLQLSCPVVLFTTADMEPLFRQMRSNRPIHIVILPFENIYMWKMYKQEWIAHHMIDPEKDIHTPELYAVWAQKPIFVEQAIRLNLFNTEFFYWCDIGAFRVPIQDVVRRTFPTCAFSPNKVLFTSVEDLNPACELYNLDGRKHTLVGGLWGGEVSACLRWRYAYEAMLIRYFAMGLFAGKDQTVMLTTYLDNTSLGEILRPKLRKQPGYDDWFFAQRLLSDEYVLAEPDTSYKISGTKLTVSVSIKGGLGSQMFQVAAAYAYTKRNGASLRILRTKRENDGRPMYWNSVLSRFSSYLTDTLPAGLAVWCEKSSYEYTPIPSIPLNGLLIEGYVQSSKYFGDSVTHEEIRRMMQPDPYLVDSLRLKYQHLFEQKERVIVVHARRTDYVSTQHNIDYHGPLGSDYYREAMKIVCEKIASPIFLLSSDNAMFWIDILPHVPQLQTYSFVIIDEDEISTLALLQQFRHFIIANSSFSWWAAWLATDRRTVIAPRQWVGRNGPSQYEDVYEPSWTRV